MNDNGQFFVSNNEILIIRFQVEHRLRIQFMVGEFFKVTRRGGQTSRQWKRNEAIKTLWFFGRVTTMETKTKMSLICLNLNHTFLTLPQFKFIPFTF